MKRKSPSTSTLNPRVGASFALIPMTFGVVVMAYFASFLSSSAEFGIFMLTLAPLMVFYGGSLIIWLPVVQWTRRKRIGTWMISLCLIGPAGALTALAALTENYIAFSASLGFSLIGGGIALILLNWLWWTPPHERASSGAVPCPRCGYDLRGQRECRCPECGESFDLSQIVAATRTQSSDDLG